MKATKFTLTLLLVILAFPVVAQLGKANKFYDRFDYSKAIPLYEKHIERNPTDVVAREKLANSYRKVKDYPNAARWYAQVVKAPNTNAQNFFYYATALINNGKAEQAEEWLVRYQAVRGWDKVADAMLQSIRNPEPLYRDSIIYEVNTVNINTAGPEFAPVIYRNSVVFAAAQNRDKIVFNWNGQAFLDLYASAYQGRSELGTPVPLKGAVNSRYHEGGVTFSPEGTTMYFTRNNYYNGKVRKDNGKIVRLQTFQAELSRGKWVNIEEFPLNDDEYSVGHPCLDQEGKVMYFISDMPGGEGGTDVWKSEMTGPNEWSKPVNMGPEINSPGDEMFPWVSSSGVFYYSSDGQGGLGGLDIYRITSIGTPLQKLKNMGHPINSPQDDFGLVEDEKTGQGFFTSNRLGGQGDDDIYSFRQRQMLEGLVLDKEDGEPIVEARVDVFDPNGLVTTLWTDQEGRFRYGLDRNSRFLLVGSAQTYMEARQKVNSVSFDPKVPVEALLKLERDRTCEPPFDLEGTVVNESNEIVPNATVKVIPQPIFLSADEGGAFNLSLQSDMDYEVIVQKNGYMDRSYDISTKGMEPGTVTLDAILGRLVTDTAMYTIYYDYDKAFIRSEAYKELDKVVDYLERNPGVKLRLVSHTDARGANYYNDGLSRKRSMSAYQYMLREGVSKDRLEYVWVGERKPAVDCVGDDCDEVQHQLNRRTELQYVGDGEKSDVELELELGDAGEDEDIEAAPEEKIANPYDLPEEEEVVEKVEKLGDAIDSAIEELEEEVVEKQPAPEKKAAPKAEEAVVEKKEAPKSTPSTQPAKKVEAEVKPEPKPKASVEPAKKIEAEVKPAPKPKASIEPEKKKVEVMLEMKKADADANAAATPAPEAKVAAPKVEAPAPKPAVATGPRMRTGTSNAGAPGSKVVERKAPKVEVAEVVVAPEAKKVEPKVEAPAPKAEVVVAPEAKKVEPKVEAPAPKAEVVVVPEAKKVEPKVEAPAPKAEVVVVPEVKKEAPTMVVVAKPDPKPVKKIANSTRPKTVSRTVEMERVADDAIQKMNDAPDTLNSSMMEVIGDPEY